MMSLPFVRTNFILMTICIICNGEFPSLTKLIQSPKDGIVMTGGTIALDCVFDALALNCYWEKDGEMVEIAGRYSFIGDRQQGNCSIQIQRASFRDDGFWRCGHPQTSTAFGVKSKSINVTVGAAPSLPVIVFDGTEVQNGSKVYLTSRNQGSKLVCWSENGSPPAKLQWKLNNETPLSGDAKLYPSTMNKKFKIVKLMANFHVRKSWQQQKLYCEAAHPSYKFPQTTYVRIVLREDEFN